MRLIDADAFIQMMEEKCDPESTLDPWVLSVCRGGVKMMPTVDAVKVVHGRWIDIDTETYTWKIRCGRCGHERSMMSTGKTYPMYCENCDARMDGKGNGNETD